MTLRRMTFAFALGMVLVFPAFARAESAQESFARGKTLLAKGDFQSALAAYSAAARADEANQQYMDQYLFVRRIISLRQRIDTEKDHQRWAYTARALHALYSAEGMLSEALSLGQKIHAKLNDESSAVLLAETQLALNQSAEAAEVLGALDKEQASPASRALLGVALARFGKMDEARQIAKTVAVPEKASPGVDYAVARLHALTGSSSQALALLTRCFESLPPSRQANFKDHAKQCPDFAGLASTGQLAKVLATKSKAPESGCSGGSGCANCPMRGQCAKDQEGK